MKATSFLRKMVGAGLTTLVHYFCIFFYPILQPLE